MPDDKSKKTEQPKAPPQTSPKPQEAASQAPKPDAEQPKPQTSPTPPPKTEAKAETKPPTPQANKPPDKPKTPPQAKKSDKPQPPKSKGKSKPPEKPKAPPTPTKAEDKAKNPPKAEKAGKPKTPPEPAKSEEKAPPPKPAPALRKNEKIVNLKIGDLRPFKNHPFSVKDDAEMLAMVESVKDKGVTQPAIVRPHKYGGYEMVSGHRRQRASELAGLEAVPCIVRNLTDEEATLQMVEDNLNQRDYIVPSERAKALKMQFETIKKQGVKGGDGRRSDEIVGERNGMSGKQVQRYIKLNDLCPELMQMVDEKKIAFSPAVHLAFIKPEQQVYIADVIESVGATPNLSQAKRMHELDEQKMLKPDVIDGIMLEEKKEVDNVIISSKELQEFFPKTATPREMKEQIMTLLQDWNKEKPQEKTVPPKGDDAR